MSEADRLKKGIEGKYGAVELGTGEDDRLIDRKSGNESNSLPRGNWHCLALMGLCTLIGDMSRGIYFPTLYLNVIRNGGDKVAAGFAVASMSAGRILVSPYFGRLSETIRHRKVLIISTSILLVGALVYSQAQSVLGIIAGQLIVGIGSGTLGVTRSYVAETTEPKHRTEYMAYLTAMQYTGFAVMPMVGAVLSTIGNEHSGEQLLDVPFLEVQSLIPYMVNILHRH